MPCIQQKQTPPSLLSPFISNTQMPWACEKVASDLGFGDDFRRVLRFRPSGING